jgi:hypothetical protein
VILKEVREWLDAHSAQAKFENIIFCVFSTADQEAYMEFLPVFFPPTHGDLENIAAPERPRHQVSSATLHAVYTQVNAIARNLVTFSEEVPEFPESVLSELIAIATCLKSVEQAVTASDNAQLNISNQVRASKYIFDLSGNSS